MSQETALQTGQPIIPVSSHSTSAFAITPNDTTDLTAKTRGLYVGVAGDVKVNMADGSTVTFKALTAGIIHPISVSRVYATGTTATNIVGVTY